MSMIVSCLAQSAPLATTPRGSLFVPNLRSLRCDNLDVPHLTLKLRIPSSTDKPSTGYRAFLLALLVTIDS